MQWWCTKAKGGWQNGGVPYNVLVAVVLRFGAVIFRAMASVIGNFGSNWIILSSQLLAQTYLNLNFSRVHWLLLVAPSTNFNVMVVSPRPKRTVNGGARCLVAVVLRFWCGDSQCERQGYL